MIITRRGEPAAVMFSFEAYERSEKERELLQLLAHGEIEVKARKGVDLESMLAEADALLAWCCEDSGEGSRSAGEANARFRRRT